MSEIRTYYSYTWLREKDWSPYYVGKGYRITSDNPSRRWKGRAYFTEDHCVKCPKDPQRIIVQDYESESDSLTAEIFLISFYGRKDLGTGCLRNLTHGGDGTSGYIHSEKTRKKMSNSKIGTPKTESHKENISIGHKKFWAENPKEKEKRKNWTERMNTSEVKAKVKRTRNTHEYKQAQSARVTEAWQDKEYREEHCKGMRGKQHKVRKKRFKNSPTHVQHMRDAYSKLTLEERNRRAENVKIGVAKARLKKLQAKRQSFLNIFYSGMIA